MSLERILNKARVMAAKSGRADRTRLGLRDVGQDQVGFHRCADFAVGRSKCVVCKNVVHWEGRNMTRRSHRMKAITKVQFKNGQTIPIKQFLTCKSTNVVYLVRDLAKKIDYSGCTKRAGLTRYKEHLYAVRSGREAASAVAVYTNRHPEFRNRLAFLPILQVKDKDPYSRRYFEAQIINKMGLTDPNFGMNRNR